MIKVLMVAAEAAPYVKTGGLGDVVGSLPVALRKVGIDARVIIPCYESISDRYRDKMTLRQEFTVPVTWRQQYCGLWEHEYKGVPFYFIDNEYYFKRPYIYGHYDDAERYAFFCRAVLESLSRIPFIPDIIHCHDWHMGVINVFLAAYYKNSPLEQIKKVFTIHNLKYQGVFNKDIMDDVLGLSWEHFTADKIEFHDQVNFLKGGLAYADRINTVSPTYAREIQYDFFGENLDSFLRSNNNRLSGIINGIDYGSYNPESDSNLFSNYDRYTLNKDENKINLQEQLGLPVNKKIPLIAIISRLVSQKGLDLIAAVMDEILTMGVQLVILGTGEERYQNLFWYAAGRYSRKVSANIYFDDVLARRLYAASDLLLMPSLYEPCGLAQLIAMRYGSLPVVRETGGLKDTVVSFNEYTGEGNGFSFANYNAHDMLYTIRRALNFYKQPEVWRKIIFNAMNSDFSWDKSARQYQILYKALSHEEAAHELKYKPELGIRYDDIFGYGSEQLQGTVH